MKIYHEAPISIFGVVQQRTDGDYALVHLLESNLAYRDMFEDAIRKGREVILDNSIFELGTAFDMDMYAFWIKKLQPTWYIVPDVWKNSAKTIELFEEFIKKYPRLPGKRVAVAQGLLFEDTRDCYKAIEPMSDMIAFNLDGSYAWNYYMAGEDSPHCTKMSKGRFLLLKFLDTLTLINRDKPHHLLGCGVPQEMAWYKKAKIDWITSVDTSNPVIAGMCNIRYPEGGLTSKSDTKLCDLINEFVSTEALDDICYNIDVFRRFCNEEPS